MNSIECSESLHKLNMLTSECASNWNRIKHMQPFDIHFETNSEDI